VSQEVSVYTLSMLIGFDGSRAFVEKRTGTEEYSYQLLKHLAKIDTKNTYIVYLRPGNRDCFPRRNVGIAMTSSRGAEATWRSLDWPSNFNFKIINHPLLWTQVGLSIQTFKDNLDVLFVPSHTIPLIRKPGLKTVMTVHDLGAEYLPTFHQLKQQLYLGFITKFQLKTATKLIAVSKSTKNDLVQKVGVATSKIDVVYEGINTEDYKPLPPDKNDQILKKFGLEDQKFFLFVGTIQPRKNLERLIRAFSLYCHSERSEESLTNVSHNKTDIKSEILRSAQNDKSYKLVLAGGKGWLSDEIYELPKKLGIEDHVEFLGYIGNDEKIGLIQSAEGFVYPSLFEGFGIPILESFALKCPVLTSNTSSMPEVANGAAVLVDPYDVESIAEGLSILSEDSKRNFFKRQGLEQLKNFSWEKCAKETLKVLESV